MKSKIFTVLAAFSFGMTVASFMMFLGTWLIFAAFAFAFFTVVFIAAAVESHPNGDEVIRRIANFISED